MCTTIWDADNRKHIETVAGLRALVGEDELVWKEGYEHARDADIPDLCLCGIDIPATLLDAGMMVWRGDIPEYNFKRPE